MRQHENNMTTTDKETITELLRDKTPETAQVALTMLKRQYPNYQEEATLAAIHDYFGNSATSRSPALDVFGMLLNDSCRPEKKAQVYRCGCWFNAKTTLSMLQIKRLLAERGYYIGRSDCIRLALNHLAYLLLNTQPKDENANER